MSDPTAVQEAAERLLREAEIHVAGYGAHDGAAEEEEEEGTRDCGAVHGMVSNTDHHTREKPRCAEPAGHPGAHASLSGLAWETPSGCVWHWRAQAPTPPETSP